MTINKCTKPGFTLVELLIVIAIIGTLVALLLPAVYGARESARRMQCTNNLRQLGLGSLAHEKHHGSFPSGGWSYRHVGAPDCGYGKSQPGGWMYSLLPFIDEGGIHDKGIGLSETNFVSAIQEVCSTPVTLFNCPTRRSAELVQYNSNISQSSFFKSGKTFVKKDLSLTLVQRGDYAGNVGCGSDMSLNGNSYGAEACLWSDSTWLSKGGVFAAQGNPARTSNRDWIANPGGHGGDDCYNGTIFFRSEISSTDVTDGTSNTYLLGEKANNPTRYFNNIQADSGGYDNETCYIGHDIDVMRWCYYGSNTSLLAKSKPRRDIAAQEMWSFGSAHPSSFSMAFCDGSVHQIQYDVEQQVHGFLGCRRDTHMIPHSSKWK